MEKASEESGQTVVVVQESQEFRLSRQTLGNLPATVIGPNYNPAEVDPEVLHIGASNFFLALAGSIAHEAISNQTPRAGERRTGGIVAASINSDGMVNALRRQDNLFVLVVRENETKTATVMGSIVESLFGPDDPEALVKWIADERIKLVTLTVSNKGYYLAHGGLDVNHADVIHDLSSPETPRSIYGYIARGLAARKAKNLPLTIASLDNIEMNSRSLKKALVQFIELWQPDLKAWVEENVAFAVTLIDRITPKVTDAVRRQTRALLGFDADVAISCEVFRQLVIEKSPFAVPDWSFAGVQVVDDAAPYWQRKFFAVNAAHQFVAIPALRLGTTYIHEAMEHPSVAKLVARGHEELTTFLPGDHAELMAYFGAIRRRFADASMGDTVSRVAARTTSKVHERLLAAVELAFAATGDVLKVPTFVSACWLLNLGGQTEFGEDITCEDADAGKLAHIRTDALAWVRSVSDEDAVDLADVRRFLGAISEALREPRFARMANNDAFVKEFTWALVNINRQGIEKAIDSLLAR